MRMWKINYENLAYFLIGSLVGCAASSFLHTTFARLLT